MKINGIVIEFTVDEATAIRCLLEKMPTDETKKHVTPPQLILIYNIYDKLEKLL